MYWRGIGRATPSVSTLADGCGVGYPPGATTATGGAEDEPLVSGAPVAGVGGAASGGAVPLGAVPVACGAEAGWAASAGGGEVATAWRRGTAALAKYL